MSEIPQHAPGCVFWLDDDSDLAAYGPEGCCTCGLYERQAQEAAMLAAKDLVIHNLSMEAEQSQWPWYRTYLEENYAAIVSAIQDGRTRDHGFRGGEVEDELKRPGLLVRRGPVDWSPEFGHPSTRPST